MKKFWKILFSGLSYPISPKSDKNMGCIGAKPIEPLSLPFAARTHTTGRTPLDEWSARRRGRYLHNTQQTRDTNIHAVTGIRTRDPSNQEAPDVCLRRHGHWDRLQRYWLALRNDCYNYRCSCAAWKEMSVCHGWRLGTNTTAVVI
jgi:hypothetical protein